MHEFADFGGGYDVLLALKYQRGHRYLRQVGTVVGSESDARKRLGDFRIGAAETVGELLAELRPVGIAHDGWCHSGRPAHMIILEEFEEFSDLFLAESTDIIAVVDVA